MSAVDLSSYRDQHFKGSRGEQERLLRSSTTMYVGNMSFYTTEEQVRLDRQTLIRQLRCVMLMKTLPYSWPELSVVCSYTSCSGSAAR